MGWSRLEEADLSQTCRRDGFCTSCFHAFCSHCCDTHHRNSPYHQVIPVDVDAAGRPVFSRNRRWGGGSMPDFLAALVAAEDYAARLPRDAYCIRCQRIFCAGTCPHHHRKCGPDAVLCIEERAGTYRVRCTGSEWWFPSMESVLGDPVGEEDEDHQLLLPVLTRAPGRCVQCGVQVPSPLQSHCSAPCAADHSREVAERRGRREARRAARELAKLKIH